MRRFFFTLILCLFAASVSAAPLAQTNSFELLVFNLRADLEVLADAVLGVGIRPQTWTGNTSLQSPTIVSDLWFDNEQLADAVFLAPASALMNGLALPCPSPKSLPVTCGMTLSCPPNSLPDVIRVR